MDNRFDSWAKSMAGTTSRREALKRFGGGMLAALLAPVAFGKARAQHPGHGCSTTSTCGNTSACGTSGCVCAETTELVHACVQNVACSTGGCTSSSGCPAGSVCVFHSCCGPQLTCLPLCGTPAGAASVIGSPAYGT
jgi:hypothetical protein